MKRNYDKKHNEKIYEPGHLVAVWTPVRKIGKCEKLLRKYFGPYRILKKLSNVNYLIEPKDNPGQDPLIVHVSRLKPYFERIDEGVLVCGRFCDGISKDIPDGSWGAEKELDSVFLHFQGYFKIGNIDDIYCEFESEKEQLILDTLNGYHRRISFTIEKEINGVLPYLDSLIMRTENSFHTTVYYKKSFEPSYLPFKSYGPISHKITVVKTLTKRLFTHCSLPKFKAIERNNIYRNLRNFGYPPLFIDQHCYNPSHHRTQQTFKTTCYIDYSPTNLKIALEMKKYGIKFFFRTPRTIGNILRNRITKSTTDQNPLQKKNAIYSVSCIDCPSIYVGETSRKIQTILKEHTYNMKTKDPRSLIFQHTMNTGHKFNLDSPTCHYSNITTKSERLILESLISKQHNSINRRIDIPEQFCHIPYHKNQISRLSNS
ncbi:hypothetical protein LAZ67_4000776 [Cordylochernes scorpioides]|uniref:GIY-YIG homing endonuclease n=1 Tax=Cordylochernes scorpioides TaxID=51811 RepID=A0ABY6KG90_9ARAC|nr:hypothetical protein LAZ67_4000776 [Cordylochernes scorpioides]